MSRHEDIIRLRHMLDHAKEAAELIGARKREDLESDRVLSLALVRLLEIMGEAAGRIPDRLRARHPDIPWSQIIGLRNRLIHGYDAVDMDILWQILTDDVPPLIEALRAIPGVEDAP